MYKNRTQTGSANLCGAKIKAWRQSRNPRVSQRALADLLQLAGIDLDKNAIQRIECGKRFVTDIELKTIGRVLAMSTEELLQE